MNINIEFFDIEPMENLVTCLHFDLDKVVFLGYRDLMTQERMNTTRKALKKTCGLDKVEFIEVSRKNLYKNVEVMEALLQKETEAGHNCFFDLTGGEDLILVAMGILSTRYQCPMHRFEIRTGKLRLMNAFEMPGIEDVVPKREVPLTLDDVIGFYGGMISYNQQKGFKTHLDDVAVSKDYRKMWKIASADQRKWNGFSSVLRACTDYEDSEYKVIIGEKELREIVNRVAVFRPYEVFVEYIKQLCAIGVLQWQGKTEEAICFSYKSKNIRDVLLDAGSLLEIMTYYLKKDTGKYSDCRVGVHIDWDGVISGDGQDVKNEIDVMLLEGMLPVFISCKNGKVDQMALYELDTVAKRFGGKYVRKEISTSQDITEGYLSRAKEMDIRWISPKVFEI